jgi:hypothetical protein
MGGVQVDLTASPGAWYLNDKFDLQNTGTSDEWSYDTVVPEPTTMIAGALLLLPFGASTLRLLRKNRKA